MASYSFDVEHAGRYGVNEAIFLQNLIHWIRKNHANGAHQHKGRTWTYNTLDAWVTLFPWLSIPQVRRIIAKLKRERVILTAHFDGSRRRTYFALADPRMAGIDEEPPTAEDDRKSLAPFHVPKSTDSADDVSKSTDARARVHQQI